MLKNISKSLTKRKEDHSLRIHHKNSFRIRYFDCLVPPWQNEWLKNVSASTGRS